MNKWPDCEVGKRLPARYACVYRDCVAPAAIGGERDQPKASEAGRRQQKSSSWRDPVLARFYDQLQAGDRVLLFGAIHSGEKAPTATPEVIDSEKATNYRRWWNNAWDVVEAAGQPHAGEWTPAKMNRLRALVERAHADGLWIRFYTLDGVTESELSCHG
jgi:hypothetical protein